jgi:hypothetical protein
MFQAKYVLRSKQKLDNQGNAGHRYEIIAHSDKQLLLLFSTVSTMVKMGLFQGIRDGDCLKIPLDLY